MAEVVYKDASIVINGVDLSDHCRSVTVNYSADTPEKTAMGDDTRNMIPNGLKNWTIDAEFNQDYASGSVDDTLFDLVGSSFTVTLKPTSAAVSATNPSYSGTGILSSYPPMGGAVGDVEVSAATIVAGGTLSRATA